ncbi:hypothetical protein BS50DRAFT_590724 [Corynespora cassiicola Philippines]|uniref:Uncharacterized protein n=1 Tax=Corynespora cassiicola Philippines TaxID=1448308 RepID=A0A2T2NE99_CORCC|nr:hypothetical protein BS50DRAFT_590724 [Corynespora cassiicola Philippines]
MGFLPYRREPQGHTAYLSKERRSRNLELARVSTFRLLLEGFVEQLKICRLRKQEQAREARERRPEVRRRARSADLNGLYKGPDDEVPMSEHHERTPSRHHSPTHEHVSGEDQRPVIPYPVVGKSNPDLTSPYMMNGGAGPPGTAGEYCNSHQEPHHGDDPQPSDKTPSRERKQRLGSDGQPLVQGRRGWRDPSPGAPPKYKFHIDPTFGFAKHWQKCTEWVQQRDDWEAKKKERRSRGPLITRREIKRAKSKPQEGKTHQSFNNSHTQGFANPAPPSPLPGNAAQTPPAPAPSVHVRFANEPTATAHGDVAGPGKSGQAQYQPPPAAQDAQFQDPTYPQNLHSQAVEERERAQARASAGTAADDLSTHYAKAPHGDKGDVSALEVGGSEPEARYLDVVGRGQTGSTMESEEWWDGSVVNPGEERGAGVQARGSEGRFFTKEFVEQLRVLSGEQGGRRGSVSTGLNTSETDATSLTSSEGSRVPHRLLSRSSFDEILRNLSADVGDPGRRADRDGGAGRG